ncbi:hypothetical protein PHMEG_00034856, partial [Phytophthora megakarya]
MVSTQLLRDPDRTKPFVIIPHANPWAACAGLGQEHEGLIHPVRFTEFPVVVYTRYSVLKGLLQSNTADGRRLKWGLELSRWTLEIHRTQQDEDDLAAILGSGITPREHLDEVAESLIPAKGRLKVMPPVSLETLEADYQGYVSTRRGSCGCILWKLSGWQVVKAEGHVLKYDVEELAAVGDSGIVVQHAQGLINCNKPNLQRRLAEYEDLRKDFVSVKLIHVKREFNQAADYLTSKTLVLGESWELNDPDEIVHLRLVSRIPDKIMKPSELPSTPAPDAVRSDQVRLRADSPDVGIPESLATAAEALMVMMRSRKEADVGSRTPVDQSGYQDEPSAKGRPPVLGPSPGNIEPKYPFEVVSMDFVTELPESDRGNTYLLLFQDQFSGYVMCKPMRNTEAQDVAEAYEECVWGEFND